MNKQAKKENNNNSSNNDKGEKMAKKVNVVAGKILFLFNDIRI